MLSWKNASQCFQEFLDSILKINKKKIKGIQQKGWVVDSYRTRRGNEIYLGRLSASMQKKEDYSCADPRGGGTGGPDPP